MTTDIMLPIEQIIVGDNPRFDFTGLDELVSSIKEKGILEPILVNKKNELLGGERRLRAARVLKLSEVPVRIIDVKDNDEIIEIKLVENLQRKNLNPIEEGVCFQNYLDSTKHTMEYLAKKLGKTKDFIERRISLLKCNESVKKGLMQKKIEVGHAVILSRFNSKLQTQKLKEIENDQLSVKDLAESLEYDDELTSLDNAPFDKKSCKSCSYNGGTQAILTDAGNFLDGHCMNKNCFVKKINVWLKNETKALKDKGINVMDISKLEEQNAKEIYEWNDEYESIVKDLPQKPEYYAIAFNTERMPPKRIVFQIKKEPKPVLNVVVKTEQLKILNLSRKERFRQKISKYKREFLTNKSIELLKPSTPQIKALLLRYMIGEHPLLENDLKKVIPVSTKCGTNPNFLHKLMESDDELIESGFKVFAKQLLCISDACLDVASKNIGVNLETHWAIDKEFLELHTIDGLQSLAKELKIDTQGISKKTDLVELFLKPEIHQSLKGKVPKVMQRRL